MHIFLRQLAGLCLIMIAYNELALAQNSTSIHAGNPSASDSHLYLRCQSTGWNLDAKTYLQATTSAHLRELRFSVDSSSTADGDECTLTATAQLHSWDAGYKNYGLLNQQLQVPQGDWIRPWPSSAPESTFQLFYPSPGQYQALVDIRNGYISLRKVGEIAAGDIAWAAPGRFTSDENGRMFLQTDGLVATLSLMDEDKGMPRWTFQGKSGSLSFTSLCSKDGRVILKHGQNISALDINTGHVLWSREFRGMTKTDSSHTICFKDSPFVFVTHGEHNTELAAVKTQDGAVQWVAQVAQQATLFASDDVNAYVLNVEQNLSYSALKLEDGQPRWQKLLSSGRFEMDAQQRLFQIDQQLVSRISPFDGQNLWSYKSSRRLNFFTHENGSVMIRDGRSIRRLAPESGAIVWSHESSHDIQGFPYISTVRNEDQASVVVRLAGAGDDTAHYLLLDPVSGQVQTRLNLPGSSGSIAQANSQAVLFQSSMRLQSFQGSTENAKWTYDFNADQAGMVLYGLVDQDAETLYLNYGYQGSGYRAMGLIALDARSGQEKWRKFYEAPIQVLTGSSKVLYLNFGGAIPSGAKAIFKR